MADTPGHPAAKDHNADALPATVFIVDDEAMVTTSIKAMLTLETDHAVHCFNSPQEALNALDEALAKETSKQAEAGFAKERIPDVVISDFLMPEMDGIAFLKAVKQRLPEATLILLTGYADKESAIQAINAVGIYRYMEKPWDNEELKINIRNGLERSRLLFDLRKTVNELTEAQGQLETYNRELEGLVAERTRDLQTTFRQLQSIVQNTADGILTLDEGLAITSVNAAAEKWLLSIVAAKKPEDFLGIPIEQVLSLPDGNHGKKSVRGFFQPDQSRLLKEALLGEMPVEVSIAPISDPAGTGQNPPGKTGPGKSGYVLVIRDIARRKEIERLRDDFVSTLTHDLRTPLLAAIQTLGFFNDGSLGPMTEKQTEVATMLIQSLRDMLGLVNVLLEVYKYESGRQTLIFDSVNLGELVGNIGNELEALSKSRNQVLTVRLEKTLPPVRGDRQELRRVFVNLMGNAINYTPESGKIEVTATEKDGLLTVCVADTGRGIPEKDLPHLFQRFSQGTSRQRSSGTGLGLYLSRQIVEAHQGSIWVESTEGEGSKFYLTLPVAPVSVGSKP